MDKLDILYKQWQELQPLSQRKHYLLNQRFMVDYNYNSNHIEGNTLTYGQTEMLLLLGKVSGEGELKDYNDMKASQVALKIIQNEGGLTDETDLKNIPLSQNFIRELHKVILREDYTVYSNTQKGIPTSYTIHAGVYKTRPNSVITRYGQRFDYATPEETAALMSDLVDWYNDAQNSGKYSAVELAALFHYRYIRIHPFEDGNGRIARLMTNYILARNGWPMVVVRSRNKSQYIDALHSSDLAVGPIASDGAHAQIKQIGTFLRYFKQLVAEQLRYNIDFVKETSPNVWWYDGQKITFRSQSTPVILNAMQQNPDITIEQLAAKSGIVTSAVKKQLKLMIDKGFIERRTSDKTWYVFICSSN